MQLDQKLLAPIKAQATKATKYATELDIKTPEQEAAAAAELNRINKIGDNIAEQKEKLLRPHLDGAKAVREFFKPFETGIEGAVNILKEKLIYYRKKAEEKEAKEKAKITKRVENGTLKTETAVKKLGELGTLEKSIEASGGSISYKNVKKARLTEIVKLSNEEILVLARDGYIVWDEGKAKKDALKGLPVPGVEVYEDKEITNKRG